MQLVRMGVLAEWYCCTIKATGGQQKVAPGRLQTSRPLLGRACGDLHSQLSPEDKREP